MYQFQIKYCGGKIRHIYGDNIRTYSQLVCLIKDNITSLGTSEFQIQYKNEDGDHITLSNNQLDMNDLYRCSDTVANADYRRIKLEIVEDYSPVVRTKALVKKRDVPEDHSSEIELQDEHVNRCTEQTRRQLSYSSVTENFKNSATWKENKIERLRKKLALLKDEKLAIEQQRKELERPVREASPVGSNTRSTCGICHRRGHRSTGNKNSQGCLVGVACKGYVYCGRKQKHANDHFAQVKTLKEKESKKRKEIIEIETELKTLEDFKSKSISAFAIEITPRLFKAFPEKYNTKSSKGKIQLQRDISIIRGACDNNINRLPQAVDSYEDRQEFDKLLQNFSGRSAAKKFPSRDKTSEEYLQDILKASPVRSKERCSSSSGEESRRRRRKKDKKRRRRDEISSSSDTSGSNSETRDERTSRMRRNTGRKVLEETHPQSRYKEHQVPKQNWTGYYSPAQYFPQGQHIQPVAQYGENVGRPVILHQMQMPFVQGMLSQVPPAYLPVPSPSMITEHSARNMNTNNIPTTAAKNMPVSVSNIDNNASILTPSLSPHQTTVTGGTADSGVPSDVIARNNFDKLLEAAQQLSEM